MMPMPTASSIPPMIGISRGSLTYRNSPGMHLRKSQPFSSWKNTVDTPMQNMVLIPNDLPSTNVARSSRSTLPTT